MSEKIIVSGVFTNFSKREYYERGENAVMIEGQLQATDGYHTFEELYDHRITLFIALCKMIVKYGDYGTPRDLRNVWRSKVNGDGTTWDGWFVMGIGKEIGKQITYHLPLRRWSETDFVEETLDQAPEFDGHTSEDVLDRLKNL